MSNHLGNERQFSGEERRTREHALQRSFPTSSRMPCPRASASAHQETYAQVTHQHPFPLPTKVAAYLQLAKAAKDKVSRAFLL